MNKVGLSIVMAQSGMYVPASEFIYYPYTKLFSRNGGKDNIIKGISTFEDEMLQLRSIFSNCDERSLILCDELASSTETDSALAIVASSIVLLNKKNCSLILSTHLHQLTKIEEIKNLKKIRICHITTEIDEKNDTLIYNRKLEDGQGSESYGLLVSKYILKNSSFTDLCLKIKNDITKDKGLLPSKKSKYNSKVLIHQCQICGKKDIDGMISMLQTHHINHQEDCNEKGFVNEKPYIKKNDLQNLAVLCVKCHNKHHNGDLDIDKYVMTSRGKVLITNNHNN
jgi:DNA mismatch repair protein MutS